MAVGLAQPSIALPGQTISPVTKAGTVSCSYVTATDVVAFSAKTWRLIRWERGKPPKGVLAAHRRHLRCAAGPGHRKAIKERWRDNQRVYFEHRDRKLEQRERLRYLPYECGGGTRSAIPCGVMLCESGGSYTARNPVSTAGGKYQILDSTWAAYGGAPYRSTHPAAVAPPAEQDRVAAAIWADVGASAWECA